MTESTPQQPKYAVYIDENFHYMDEHERSFAGSYDDCASAIAACKQIVERSLEEQYSEGMTAEHLLRQYKAFGEDPWISSAAEDCKFSAWNYAEDRCKEICGIK